MTYLTSPRSYFYAQGERMYYMDLMSLMVRNLCWSTRVLFIMKVNKLDGYKNLLRMLIRIRMFFQPEKAIYPGFDEGIFNL
jgi:hypothetical protein